MEGSDETDRAIIVSDPTALDVEQSQPVIYDRQIGVRLLHRDVRSGAEHYLIRYPEGLQARRHRHTADHTIVVLEGTLEVNGQLLGAGGYCHLPAGCEMHHAPAAGESCVFITIFHGPFDVETVDD